MTCKDACYTAMKRSQIFPLHHQGDTKRKRYYLFNGAKWNGQHCTLENIVSRAEGGNGWTGEPWGGNLPSSCFLVRLHVPLRQHTAQPFQKANYSGRHLSNRLTKKPVMHVEGNYHLLCVLKCLSQTSSPSDEEALRIPASKCTGKAAAISMSVRIAHVNIFCFCRGIFRFQNYVDCSPNYT